MVKDFLAALEIKKSLDNEYDFFFVQHIEKKIGKDFRLVMN